MKRPTPDAWGERSAASAAGSRTAPRPTRRDQGVALIAVLFLAAMLTLLLYAYLREAQVEAALANGYGREKQAECLAWSAIEKGGAALISDGSPNPYRYRVRPPTLINLTLLEEMCLGHTIADSVVILGSIDIVLGEVDR